MDYDYLERITELVKQGDSERVGQLSTGERLYVALASSRCDLLEGNSIAYALSRLGKEGIEQIITRHQYD